MHDGIQILLKPHASRSGNDTSRSGPTEFCTMLIEAHDALKRAVGDTEFDFEVEQNKFAFSPGQLRKLYNPRSLGAFYALSGLDGIEKSLETQPTAGPSMNEANFNQLVVSGCRVITGKLRDMALRGDIQDTKSLDHKRTSPCVGLSQVKAKNATICAPLVHQKEISMLNPLSFQALWGDIATAWLSVVMFILLLIVVLSATELFGVCTDPLIDSFAMGQVMTVVVRILVSVLIGIMPGVTIGTLVGNMLVDHAKPKHNHQTLRSSYGPDAINEHSTATRSPYKSNILIPSTPATSCWLDSGILQGSLAMMRPLLRSSIPSPTIGRLLPFLFFARSHAQGLTAGTNNKYSPDWRQRALGALTDHLVTFAFLLFPLMVLVITGCAADRLHRKSQEGKAVLSMLGMAVIFIAIPAPSGSGATANDDRYMRIAVGLAYTFFMTVYCRLIAIRHGWYKGRCAVAGALAIFITIVGMASASVQSYWVDSTKTDPFFILSVAIPASFTLCDLAAYLSDAFNDRVNHRAPDLPLPVPGPQQG
jgi:hypothetical protein